ncbi:MAG: putative phospholipid-binding protein [Micavibrio sp.]|nr:putative phospholipid-binding protein [Micavibrio sp.]
MKLKSPAFRDSEDIPALFTHDGDNISPPLQWSGAPSDTASFALILQDPDAPNGVFTHWILYNIPNIMRGLDREVAVGGHYGTHALQGTNSFGTIGYGGPKPPSGEHRYIFTLYALDIVLDLEEGALKEDLLGAMSGHILDQAKLTGLYAKHDALDVSKELSEERSEEDAYDLSVHYDETQPEARDRL